MIAARRSRACSRTSLALTGCSFGFIGEVLERPDGSPFLRTHAVSDIAWNDATRDWYEEYRESGLEFDNPEHAVRPHPDRARCRRLE